MNKSLRIISLKSSSGTTLRGILHLPPEEETDFSKIAILLSGLVGNRVGPHRILFDIANIFAENRLPTVRFDLSGSGYSDGDKNSITMKNLIQDVKEIMDFLKEQHGVKEFLLGGICRGAKVALETTLNYSSVNNLMLLSCPRLENDSLKKKSSRRRRKHFKKYIRKLFTFRWIPRLFSGDLNWDLIGKAIFKPINKKTLGKVKIEKSSINHKTLLANTIFVYGENDPDLNDSLKYFKNKLGNSIEKVNYKIVPGSDQGFYRSDWHEEVLKNIQEWWDNQH